MKTPLPSQKLVIEALCDALHAANKMLGFEIISIVTLNSVVHRYTEKYGVAARPTLTKAQELRRLGQRPHIELIVNNERVPNESKVR